MIRTVPEIDLCGALLSSPDPKNHIRSWDLSYNCSPVHFKYFKILSFETTWPITIKFQISATANFKWKLWTYGKFFPEIADFSLSQIVNEQSLDDLLQS